MMTNEEAYRDVREPLGATRLYAQAHLLRANPSCDIRESDNARNTLADVCSALALLLDRTEPKPEAAPLPRIGEPIIRKCVAPTGPGWYVVLRPDDAVPTIVRVDSVSATELRVWRHGNINGAPLKGYTFFARIEL